MTFGDDRLRIVETRCTGFALELLRELKSHSVFPEVLERVEQIQGIISRSDIEAAFVEIIKDKPGRA